MDLIDSLERFAIGVDRDLQLERETNRKWREAQKFSAPADRRELQAQAISGKVLDAATLNFLYQERQRIDSKRAKRRKHLNSGKPLNSGKGKQVQLDISDGDSDAAVDDTVVVDTSD